MIEYPRTEWGASQAVIALRLRVRRQDADPWEYIPIPDSDNADVGKIVFNGHFKRADSVGALFLTDEILKSISARNR